MGVSCRIWVWNSKGKIKISYSDAGTSQKHTSVGNSYLPNNKGQFYSVSRKASNYNHNGSWKQEFKNKHTHTPHKPKYAPNQDTITQSGAMGVLLQPNCHQEKLSTNIQVYFY